MPEDSESESESKVDANLSAVTAAVDRELTAAAAVKSSFESRSIAIFALNLGVATLYLALRDVLGLPDPLGHQWSRCVVVGSLILAAISICLAVAAVWPVRAGALNSESLNAFFDNVKDPHVSVEGLILREQIAKVDNLHASNSRRGVLITIAFMATALSIVGFSFGILLSL